MDGYLGSLQFGAIINKTVMNIWYQFFGEHMFSFIFGKFPGMHLLDPTAGEYLVVFFISISTLHTITYLFLKIQFMSWVHYRHSTN